MKKSMALFSILSCIFFTALGQKNYIVIYDKLDNSTHYKEVKYDRGKGVEKDIKCPSVERGDVITFRFINTNEMVFDVIMEKEEKVEAKQSNALKTISNLVSPFGFAGPISGIADVLYSTNLDDAISLTRGEEAESSEMAAIKSEFSNLNTEYNNVYTQALKLENVSKLLLSEEKTLTEIRSDFNQAIKAINTNEFQKSVDELLNHRDDIMNMMEENKVSNNDLNSSYQEIIDMIDFFEAQYLQENSTIDLKSMQKMLSKMDFVEEQTVVVQTSNNEYNVVSSVEFLAYFGVRNNDGKDSDTWGSKIPSETRICRSFTFPLKGSIRPSWVAGAAWVSPFVDVNSFQIQDVGFYGDSLLINTTPLGGSKLCISSTLDFKLTENTNVIPSINLGAAARPKKGELGNVSFLAGGSLRFRKFPYLSLTGGLSFTEVKMLKTNYTIGQTYLKPVGYSDYSPEDNNALLFDFKYKPGYYLGVNLNF